MLSSFLADKRVVVCCGAGGVGKTTTSAALGIAAARRGQRVVVLTIDPAKRLADALGLPALPSEPAPIAREILDRAGVPPEGTLHALMLDAKDTFDGLVRRLNPDPAAADRILQNRLYGQVSGLLAGMQEYTAEEKLHELYESGRFDVVIVDTPPTRNALDFLEAPGKMARFFDDRVLRWFKPADEPGRLRLLAARTGMLVSGVLDRAFGEGFAGELGDFFSALGPMTAMFRAHAEAVRRLLGSPEATFVLVTAPEPAAIDDALFFRRRLAELGLPFSGYVVNRLHPDRPEVSPAELRATGAALAGQVAPEEAEELLGRVAASYEEERARSLADRAALSRLLREGRAPIVGVPHLEGDIADVTGLALLVDRAFVPSSAT